MKGISIRSLILAGALVALASVPARANTITPTASLFSPGVSIIYDADLTSGELHAGDGFTVFDIGGFLGFGAIAPDWVASSTVLGSPWSPPPSLGPDSGAMNVHFTYTGAAFQVALGGNLFTPFTVLTSGTVLIADDWISRDHLIGDPGVVGDGAPATAHRDTILVPFVAGVPDGGSTAALLGSVLFAFGMLRRRFS